MYFTIRISWCFEIGLHEHHVPIFGPCANEGAGGERFVVHGFDEIGSADVFPECLFLMRFFVVAGEMGVGLFVVVIIINVSVGIVW